ncbi:hypothetical protein G5V59_17815 [Nocardioides sp. W3-2-3]|nr:hypothetical protein [Nocardioides convexus]
MLAESSRFAGMVAATASSGDPGAATDALPVEPAGHRAVPHRRGRAHHRRGAPRRPARRARADWWR